MGRDPLSMGSCSIHILMKSQGICGLNEPNEYAFDDGGPPTTTTFEILMCSLALEVGCPGLATLCYML